MHTKELLELFDKWACGTKTDPIVQIVKELITRSDLQTAAIVAMHEPGVCSQLDNDMALLTHHVAPKKKYTVEDIVTTRRIGGWCVECDIYGWSGEVWLGIGAAFEYRSEHDAEAVASRLRATNNLPEEYK